MAAHLRRILTATLRAIPRHGNTVARHILVALPLMEADLCSILTTLLAVPHHGNIVARPIPVALQLVQLRGILTAIPLAAHLWCTIVRRIPAAPPLARRIQAAIALVAADPGNGNPSHLVTCA
jgi:hypothetical protein